MLGQGAPHSMELGQLGSNLISDTTERTGDWGVIQAMADTVFAKLGSTTVRKGDDSAVVADTDFATLTLYAGDRLFGRFSLIKLTSGVVIAYKI